MTETETTFDATAQPIAFDALGEPEELLTWYPHQLQPETVHLYLDPEANDGAGRLLCEADSGGGGTPSNVWHGLVRRFALPLLSANGANALMRSNEVQALAARIVAGYSHAWDGSNHVGRLPADAVFRDERCSAVQVYPR